MKPTLRFIFLYAALLLTIACKSMHTEPAETPAWLQTLIAQIETKPVTNPPSAIYRYSYRGAPVYYRIARCCDIRSVLYDANGAILCAPDGGISANGDGRCPDFRSARSQEQLVWQDPRS